MMSNWKKWIYILFALAIISCSTTSPLIKLQDYSFPDKKIPLKVAVIENIGDNIDTVVFPYPDFIAPDYSVPAYEFTLKTGKLSLNHFKNVFGSLFMTSDYYKNSNINLNEYDLIIEIDMSSEMSGELCPSRDCANTFYSTYVSYDLSLFDNKYQLIDTITSSGKTALIESNQSTWSRDREFSLFFYQSMNKAFYSMVLNLQKSTKLNDYIKLVEMRKTLPAILTAALNYSDDASIIPNKTIDSGEETVITVKITNHGKGTAFDVNLKNESDNTNIEFPSSVSLGDIPPGESKDAEVKVKANLDIEDGTIPFKITCTEKRGYNCKTYKLNVQSAKYEKPELIITGYKINDSNTGLADGNGNGIPENGETIEIIPLLKNNGIGKAINVDLFITSINSDIKIKNRSVNISEIPPGQTVTGNLAFSIPTTFADNTIDLNIKATDVREEASTTKLFALNTEINQPVLAYTYRIIDRQGKVRNSIQNGEYAEIEMIPSNKGKLDARDVSIDLKANYISLSKTHDKITRIGAQSEYTPIRFPFQVPRTIEKSSIDIRVKLSQRDFYGISDTINIPLRLVRPDFKITYQLLDRNNNSILEQGENADLLVKVENTGQLGADDVKLVMDINKKGVLINGKKEVNLGRIEAGKASAQERFSINVQRIADAGELPLNFRVTEKNFGSKDILVTMHIAEEQEEVITVKGQERPKQQFQASPSYYNFPPTIAIAAPYDNERFATDSVMLRGTTTDDKGIANVEVLVNGRRINTAGRGVRIKARNDSNPKEHNFIDNIPLQTGENIITVIAYDIENLSSTKTLTVYRESKKGEIWAAVIGINQYKNRKLNLKYARNDAEAFADYMKTNMGLDSEHVIEQYDQDATQRNIKSLLGTQLRRKVRKEDTLFIFFAGHGAPEDDPASPDQDKIRKYLLPYDAEIEDLYTTAIAMDEIAEIFGRIQAERIVFMIDSCYSGAGGGRTILAQSGRSVLSDEFLNRIAQGRGRIILTSSRQNEISKESDKLKHGFFTYYLIKGLKGEADLNDDKIIDLDEISFYLNKQVPEATNNSQHPVKKGQAEGQVIIGRVKK